MSGGSALIAAPGVGWSRQPRAWQGDLGRGLGPPPGPLPALRPGPALAYRGPGAFDLCLLPVLKVRGFHGKSGFRRRSERPPGRNE